MIAPFSRFQRELLGGAASVFRLRRIADVGVPVLDLIGRLLRGGLVRHGHSDLGHNVVHIVGLTDVERVDACGGCFVEAIGLAIEFLKADMKGSKKHGK